MKPFVFLLFTALLVSSCSDDSTELVVTSPKLKSVTYFLQNQLGQFRPGEKTEYQYSADQKLIKDSQSEYDIVDKTYYLFSTSEYSYSDNRLVRIEKSIVGQSGKMITTFEYTNDRVSKIKEDTQNGVDTEAIITYLPNDVVEIRYNHSNGRWFIYRFSLAGGNVNSEQTIGDDNELASEVTHVFDSGKNPLTLLGYTDLFFTTVSTNNRIKTETNIIKAPYPQSAPVSYTYEYNELGYPKEQITQYKSLGSSGYSSLIKVAYEYQ